MSGVGRQAACYNLVLQSSSQLLRRLYVLTLVALYNVFLHPSSFLAADVPDDINGADALSLEASVINQSICQMVIPLCWF